MGKNGVRKIGLGAIWLVMLGFWGTNLVALAKTPNDPFYASQQWYLEAIGAPAAWEVTTGAEGMIVAVLDSGVVNDHPDLTDNLWVNLKELPNNGRDDDQNGYVDDLIGWDFVDEDNNPAPEFLAEMIGEEDLDHGTFVAGIIGAVGNNGMGFTGLLWQGKVMPLRVLNANGEGEVETVIRAIDYAVFNGAKVINMSFAGEGGEIKDLRAAIERAQAAGVVIVAAVGNSALNLDDYPQLPACIDQDVLDLILGVAAVNEQGGESDFTNYGKSCVDLAAPGVNIWGLEAKVSGERGYGGPVNGTSLATPIVSGAVGLLLSAVPELTAEQVAWALRLSAEPITSELSYHGALGSGRLNIAKALEYAPIILAGGLTAWDEVVDRFTEIFGDIFEDADTTDVMRDFQALAEYSYLAHGSAIGEQPMVKVMRGDGKRAVEFAPYDPEMKEGVTVALWDVRGDLWPELHTLPERGESLYRIFNLTGGLVSEREIFSGVVEELEMQVGFNDFYAEDSAEIGLTVITGVVGEVAGDAGVGVRKVVVFDEDGVERGNFEAKEVIETGRMGVALGHFNEDQLPEVWLYSKEESGRVYVYNLAGKLLVQLELVSGAKGIRMDLADVEGNSNAEMVVSTGERLYVFRKRGEMVGVMEYEGLAQVVVTNFIYDDALDIVLAPIDGFGVPKVFTVDGLLQGSLKYFPVPEAVSFDAW